MNHPIIKLRRGTAAQWAASQPQPGGEVLKLGEPGYEKDTGKLKIGDGSTPWNSLPYLNGGASISPEDLQDLLGDSGFLVEGDGIGIVYDDDNNTLTISNTKSTYDAAVEWTANHTLVDGTRYLANDLVYSSGNLYRAKFDNESILVTDTTYWENVGPGYRLNIDGRDIPNIPNPFDQNLNTTDSPRFSGVGIDTTNPNDKLHIKDGNIRLQSSQHTEENVTQKSAIIYTTQNEDVEIAKIEMERTAWAGAPSNINFYTRINENVNKVVSIRENGTIQLLLDGGGITFPDNTTQNTAYTGGLSDSNTYIICKTGDDLAAKYAAAKSLTPGGNPLSSTNRATLIIMPGNYNLSEELVIDTEFVDILGLGSMKLDRGCVTAVTLLNYTINVTANNVRVKGIGVGTQNFKIGDNLPLQIIEDCIGGNNSFGDSGNTLSGSFINCIGGNSSFGSGGTASGTFINCEATENSFGGGGGTASGIFRNCVGGEASFGGGISGTCSGTFEYCFGDRGSFASNSGGVLSGILLYCRLVGDLAFRTPSGSGKIRLCIDGNYDVINADAP